MEELIAIKIRKLGQLLVDRFFKFGPLSWDGLYRIAHFADSGWRRSEVRTGSPNRKHDDSIESKVCLLSKKGDE